MARPSSLPGRGRTQANIRRSYSGDSTASCSVAAPRLSLLRASLQSTRASKQAAFCTRAHCVQPSQVILALPEIFALQECQWQALQANPAERATPAGPDSSNKWQHAGSLRKPCNPLLSLLRGRKRFTQTRKNDSNSRNRILRRFANRACKCPVPGWRPKTCL